MYRTRALRPLAFALVAWLLAWILPFTDARNSRAIFLLGISAFLYLVTLFRAALSRVDQMITINFCIYNIFIFLLPAMNHCYRGYFPFFDMRYDVDVIEKTANLVVLFSCVFFVGHNYSTGQFRPPVMCTRAPSVTNMTLLSAFSIPVAIGFGAIEGFDFFVVRRFEYFEITYGNQPFELIVIWMARTISFLGFVVALLRLNQRMSWGALVVVGATSVTFLLLNYPLAIPRTYLFGYIIVVLLLYVDFRKPTNKLSYVFACVLALITVFPDIDYLARDQYGIAEFDILDRYLGSGDFDGFQSTINVVIYVDNLGVNFGRNILSALLFFIPRWAWEGKSRGTGAEAAEHLQLAFTNLSAPIMAETYVDFGVVGAFAGGLLIGWFMAKFDRRSDSLRSSSSLMERLTLSVMGGFVMILARGSLVQIVGPLGLLFGFSEFTVWFTRSAGVTKKRGRFGLGEGKERNDMRREDRLDVCARHERPRNAGPFARSLWGRRLR